MLVRLLPPWFCIVSNGTYLIYLFTGTVHIYSISRHMMSLGHSSRVRWKFNDKTKIKGYNKKKKTLLWICKQFDKSVMIYWVKYLVPHVLISTRCWNSFCGLPCVWRRPCLSWLSNTWPGVRHCTLQFVSVTMIAKQETKQRYVSWLHIMDDFI